MTEESLNGFLDRVNGDAAFRNSVFQDPAAALAQFDLGAPAQAAGAVDDEDALRRLAGASVPQEARVWTWIKKKMSKLFCGPGRTRSWECPKTPSDQ